MPKTATRQKTETKTNKNSTNGAASRTVSKAKSDNGVTDIVNRREAQAENVSRRKSQKDLIKQTEPELLREMLYQMVLGRYFEQKCAEVYRIGKIGGFCHLYIGQEAVGIGTMMVLREDDYVITAYRDHVQAMVKGISPEEVMAELYGKAGGCVGGK
ncbi:MAG: thiamine pyrophosphate-dependent enzyme, partial [Acidobacteriota bacterium]|nr:thiamine pyrophosphate-dependent enzyme [Acidobacteriota bacterium]